MVRLSSTTVTAAVMAMMAVAGGAAEAGTATSNLNVSATVTTTCSISAGSLAFTSYDPVAGTQVDGQATVSVACTKGASATVTLGQGAHADTGSTDAIPLRRMQAGSGFLAYALYSDSGRSATWGNTAGTGVAYSATSVTATSLNVYGRIAASQDVPAGSYTDVVVATVSF